ncbi:hypothetical protein [Cobetia amphilecti]|uniref:hypothetical protein n=1 Tax=Cobetia amphilecti TaxID=1055104 RepID=UPI003296CCA6
MKTAAARMDHRQCEALWKSALALYVTDCRAALHSKSRSLGNKEAEEAALEDLLTDQAQLGRLCDALGLDTEYMSARIMGHIED